MRVCQFHHFGTWVALPVSASAGAGKSAHYIRRLSFEDLRDLGAKLLLRIGRWIFALGLLFWMYSRNPAKQIDNIEAKFGRKPRLAEANIKVFKAGYHYGETSEAFAVQWNIPPASLRTGCYRMINGNEAMALGLVSAAQLAKKTLIYSSYPITPASEILHHLSRL